MAMMIRWLSIMMMTNTSTWSTLMTKDADLLRPPPRGSIRRSSVATGDIPSPKTLKNIHLSVKHCKKTLKNIHPITHQRGSLWWWHIKAASQRQHSPFLCCHWRHTDGITVCRNSEEEENPIHPPLYLTSKLLVETLFPSRPFVTRFSAHLISGPKAPNLILAEGPQPYLGLTFTRVRCPLVYENLELQILSPVNLWRVTMIIATGDTGCFEELHIWVEQKVGLPQQLNGSFHWSPVPLTLGGSPFTSLTMIHIPLLSLTWTSSEKTAH